MDKFSTLQLQVVVLKTKINTEEEIQHLGEIFQNLDTVLKWTVDRQDTDKVLRIETLNTSTQEIMELLGSNQIFCEELPD